MGLLASKGLWWLCYVLWIFMGTFPDNQKIISIVRLAEGYSRQARQLQHLKLVRMGSKGWLGKEMLRNRLKRSSVMI